MGVLSPSYEPSDCEIAQVGKFVVALISHSQTAAGSFLAVRGPF